GGTYIQSSNAATDVVLGATLGGTASAIGGGKFSNGAITGAYSVLFNHWMHNSIGQQGERLNIRDKNVAYKLIQKMINIEQNDLSGTIYDIFDDDALKFNEYKRYKVYEREYKGSLVDIVIYNPKTTRPDLGRYYMVTPRPFGQVYNQAFGVISIAGADDVVTIKFYNQNIYNETYKPIFNP
ncbi:MAG: hypothetical protein JEZ03_15740, partial [Bacteroidales bacterium]|nr:hypothetical protein [Bacteroidales bacterium]